ncbi:uncharacterized protein LOC115897586 [Rhinopithecus roxellana]|uniref:uncharacterized protein LOC115897586 n=1 Tax=Rhinopithecus roxellana TaxID=61622 RepID=UPI0012372A3C|nr:uncharacterized protein LOC115897586 [Rhinopithecus roxellana]
MAQLVKEPAGAPESPRPPIHPRCHQQVGTVSHFLENLSKSARQVERRSQYLSGRAVPPEPAGEEGAWELTSRSGVEASEQEKVLKARLRPGESGSKGSSLTHAGSGLAAALVVSPTLSETLGSRLLYQTKNKIHAAVSCVFLPRIRLSKLLQVHSHEQSRDRSCCYPVTVTGRRGHSLFVSRKPDPCEVKWPIQGLLPDLSLGGFPETEPTPAKTWADRRGQGIRGPGPSEESEKCSQEDARLLRPVADTRGQGGAAGTAAGGGSRPDPARGRTKGGRGGRLLAPACGVAPLRHRSGRGEPRARPPRAVAGKGDTAHACGARRRLPARPSPRAGGGPAPFQAQQRPRRGPALTHFPSRLLGPRPRIQRPPPSSPSCLTSATDGRAPLLGGGSLRSLDPPPSSARRRRVHFQMRALVHRMTISSHQLKTLREKRLTCSEQGGILLADCS